MTRQFSGTLFVTPQNQEIHQINVRHACRGTFYSLEHSRDQSGSIPRELSGETTNEGHPWATLWGRMNRYTFLLIRPRTVSGRRCLYLCFSRHAGCLCSLLPRCLGPTCPRAPGSLISGLRLQWPLRPHRPHSGLALLPDSPPHQAPRFFFLLPLWELLPSLYMVELASRAWINIIPARSVSRPPDRRMSTEGDFCPTRGHRATSGRHFWVSQMGRECVWLLAPNGQRPGMLLNVPQGTRQPPPPPTTRDDLAQNGSSSEDPAPSAETDGVDWYDTLRVGRTRTRQGWRPGLRLFWALCATPRSPLPCGPTALHPTPTLVPTPGVLRDPSRPSGPSLPLGHLGKQATPPSADPGRSGHLGSPSRRSRSTLRPAPSMHTGHPASAVPSFDPPGPRLKRLSLPVRP
ncbi:uncharacterized protein LOC131516347 [Neofelis nebulosa]|uniref:uncharacterized protein LOC131516347 n=1 Tax=Neofelis nebulosa TaxID=61452 RepID=UPI002729DC60|nr:uncharacterized protein LOC131516347 [Neofelis nebulosa]XP_058593214.1 uncharacterized protein LOC131516347 [Neofelis nebulosa]